MSNAVAPHHCQKCRDRFAFVRAEEGRGRRLAWDTYCWLWHTRPVPYDYDHEMVSERYAYVEALSEEEFEAAMHMMALEEMTEAKR